MARLVVTFVPTAGLVVALAATAWPIVTLAAAGWLIVALAAADAVARWRPGRAVVVRLWPIGLAQLILAVVVIIIAALAPLVLEARTAFTQDAEIMVRELQIIFGLNAVARELRIARHTLVFLEQLRRIATLAIVLAIAGLSALALALSLGPLSPAAATAATLTIVDQMPTSLRGNRWSPLAWSKQNSAALSCLSIRCALKR